MLNFRALIDSFRDCGCGMDHRCGIHDIRIGSGLVTQVGEILRENGFPRRLLLIGDRDTLAAAAGLEESLTGFEVTRHCYDTLRVATMDDVRLVEDYLDRLDAVVAVGTGSIHDPSRLACARRNKPLCLFATAPSMDGFASYNAPIVDGGFKTTHAAKCPEVIIADTKILAAAPKALKSAGFGDMISKYIALIDWQVSHLVTGETYCPRVAELTRTAVDRLMTMAGRETVKAHPEVNDWDAVYRAYGPLAGDVRKLNTPDTITDGIDPRVIEEKWPEIRAIVRSVPDYDACYRAMKAAGCKTTIAEIGKDPAFVAESLRYHPYMRRRLSLRRVARMVD